MGAAITTDNFDICDNNELPNQVHGFENGDAIVVKTPVPQIALSNINTQELMNGYLGPTVIT